MCHDATARMASTPRSVHAARTFVAAHLDEWGAVPTDIAYERVADAVLVASELVSNAVKFCRDRLELHVVTHADRIEIAVTDGSPRPAELKASDPLTPGGRGLLLVDALADRWGQRHHGGGKTVWATLGVPSGSALAEHCTQADR